MYKKGNSKDALGVAKASLKNFKLFCKDTYGEELHDTPTQLKTEERDGKVFNFLNDFIDWMSIDPPEVLWKQSDPEKRIGSEEKTCKEHVITFHLQENT